MTKNLSFWDYLAALAQWRRRIIINLSIVGVLSVAVALSLPKWYRSFATIIPVAEQESGLLGAASVLGQLPASLGGLTKAPLSMEAAVYLAILNSRTLMDSVVRHFNLMELYKAKTMEDAIKELRQHVKVELNDDGTISVAAEARTGYFSFGKRDSSAKKLAYAMAKYIVEKLDEMNRNLRGQKARQNRLFLEQRYLQNLADLREAEEKLKEFQDKYGAVSLPEQVEAMIQTMAELKAKLLVREAESRVMAQYLGANHPQLQRVRAEIREMRRQYASLLGFESLTAGSDSSQGMKDILLRFTDLPELGLEYARLYREVLTQQKIQEILLPQYEQAKIEEARNTPTLQILDAPVIPEKKARPRRALVVLGLVMLAFVLHCLVIYLHERLRLMQSTNPEGYDRVTRALRSWHLMRGTGSE